MAGRGQAGYWERLEGMWGVGSGWSLTMAGTSCHQVWQLSPSASCKIKHSQETFPKV